MWTPSETDWPERWEPVDLFWAKRALEFGHARTLGRYIREADEIDPVVVRRLRQMLDPKLSRRLKWRLKPEYRGLGRPSAGNRLRLQELGLLEISDLLDPPYDRAPLWQISFKRQKGRPATTRQYWIEHAIGMDVWSARRGEGGKLWLAIEDVMRRRVISRATVHRAWKNFPGRKFSSSTRPPE
jgi:hypothetical protein